MRNWKTKLVLAVALGAPACDDEAHIGYDSCPPGSDLCNELLPAKEADPHDVSAVGSLDPTWSVATELELQESGGSWLVGDADQGLWLFGVSGDGEVLVKRYALDGSLRHSRVIAPTQPGLRPPVLLSATLHSMGPVVSIDWGAEDGPEDHLRAVVLVFDEAENEAASTRVEPRELRERGQVADLAFRSESGDSITIPFQLGGRAGFEASQYSLDGELEWHVDLPADLTLPGTLPHLLAPLPDGRLVSPVNLNGERHLVTLSESGEIGLYNARYLGEGEWGFAVTTRDEDGNLVVVAEETDGSTAGDLSVFRVDLDGGRVEREHWLRRLEYSDLTIDAVSVDETNAIFVATATGGRDAASVKPVLCRVPNARRADCRGIPERPMAMQATGDGVVYMLSSLGDQLLRFDWE